MNPQSISQSRLQATFATDKASDLERFEEEKAEIKLFCFACMYVFGIEAVTQFGFEQKKHAHLCNIVIQILQAGKQGFVSCG